MSEPDKNIEFEGRMSREDLMDQATLTGDPEGFAAAFLTHSEDFRGLSEEDGQLLAIIPDPMEELSETGEPKLALMMLSDLIWTNVATRRNFFVEKTLGTIQANSGVRLEEHNLNLTEISLLESGMYKFAVDVSVRIGRHWHEEDQGNYES